MIVDYLKAVALSTFAIFAPIQATLTAAAALIAADLIVGVIAAVKRKERITSAGLRRTVSKVFTYEMALMMGFLGEKYLLPGEIPVVKLISGVIAAVELKSILESLDEVNGSSVFASIIRALGSKNDKKEP